VNRKVGLPFDKTGRFLVLAVGFQIARFEADDVPVNVLVRLTSAMTCAERPRVAASIALLDAEFNAVRLARQDPVCVGSAGLRRAVRAPRDTPTCSAGMLEV